MDKVLRLWGVVERSVIRSTYLPEMITSVGFTQDGQQVIAGSFTGEVVSQQCGSNPSFNKPLTSLARRLGQRFFDVNTFKFNTQFLAASTRGQNASGHKITSIVPFPVPSTGGERILISSNGKSARIRLFHVQDKLEEVKFGGHENSSSQIKADWSDDGRYVISGSESGEVVVWDSGLVCQAGGKGWLALKKSKTGPPFEHWHGKWPYGVILSCGGSKLTFFFSCFVQSPARASSRAPHSPPRSRARCSPPRATPFSTTAGTTLLRSSEPCRAQAYRSSRRSRPGSSAPTRRTRSPMRPRMPSSSRPTARRAC